jgi:hypothetical protein
VITLPLTKGGTWEFQVTVLASSEAQLPEGEGVKIRKTRDVMEASFCKSRVYIGKNPPKEVGSGYDTPVTPIMAMIQIQIPEMKIMSDCRIITSRMKTAAIIRGEKKMSAIIPPLSFLAEASGFPGSSGFRGGW